MPVTKRLSNGTDNGRVNPLYIPYQDIEESVVKRGTDTVFTDKPTPPPPPLLIILHLLFSTILSFLILFNTIRIILIQLKYGCQNATNRLMETDNIYKCLILHCTKAKM
jgi:hypothetical protein